MVMDVQIVDGLFVVRGRSAVKLKQRFPEVELRSRHESAPITLARAERVMEFDPRATRLYVDVERAAYLIGTHAATTTAATASSSDIVAALVDEDEPVDLDEWDDIALDGSYARGFVVTIFGDDEPAPDAIAIAFRAGYVAGWRDAALSWVREHDFASRLDGPIVVAADALIGRRVVAHVERGVVRRVVVRDTSPVAMKERPLERGYVDALLSSIAACGFDLTVDEWWVDLSPVALEATIRLRRGGFATLVDFSGTSAGSG